jgi:hypothetical protein
LSPPGLAGEDEDAELFGKISAVEQKHFKMF